MWTLAALLLAGLGWWLFRRWKRNRPLDARLTVGYWRNSALVLALYLLSILLGAGITRIMVGWTRDGWAHVLMLGFFGVWVLYGALWLARFLPTTRGRPEWMARTRGWIDGAALLTLAALATGARML